MDNLILIDGNSLINRAYFALPPLSNDDGQQTHAIYGFCNMLIKLIQEYKPKHIVAVFDLPKPTFRHKMYSEYKATRKKMDPELASQIPILKDLLRTMGVTIKEKEGYEADDVIGTIAKATSEQTYIVTGDRDSLQLIDATTTVLLTKKGISEIYTVDEKELLSAFQLTPRQIIEYKALAGDSSDNIPGVAGVGDKTATQLLTEYVTLENIYEHVGEIKGKLQEKLIASRDKAFLSRELATIDTAVPIEFNLDECGYNFPFSASVRDFFSKLKFRTLVSKSALFANNDDGSVNLELDEKQAEVIEVKAVSEIKNIILGKKLLAFYMPLTSSVEKIRFSVGADIDYELSLSYSLLDSGLAYGDVIKAFAAAFEDEKIEKIIFDVKALKKVLAKNSIGLVNFFDTKLCQYVIDVTSDYSSEEGLSAVYGKNCGAAAFISIYEKQKQKLAKEELGKLYYEMELPLINVLVEMENNGFAIDLKVLERLKTEYESELISLSEEIHNLAGKIFNINSPKQLAVVLFEDLKIPYPKKTKNYSTAAEILEELDSPIVEKVLAYRFLSKLKSTYIDGLKSAAGSDSIIHTDFKQMLTATGRLSSVEPNLQNIPIREEKGKKLREIFVPRGKDRYLVCADYSQIELRLMAHFSADPTMLEAYKNGEDIHASTASKVFNLPLSEVTSSNRRDAKAVNFGIIYGISEFGLAKNLKIKPYKARDFIDHYFDHFSSVKKFQENSVKKAKEAGYAETLFGRRRKISELFSSNQTIVKFGERAAMNMPLQGTAADIIKLAMIKVFDRLKGMESKLILQVHDELIIDATASELEEIKGILKECMENVVSLKVPLLVDVSVGKSWNMK